MKREILINASEMETRVAIIEDRKLVEIYISRDSEDRAIGNIYKGVVAAVLPGMQSAFVDIGLEKSGFLHVSDIGDFLYEEDDEDNDTRYGDYLKKREVRIQDQLRKGQEVLVQVTKEPIGTKGPRVTSQISIPGRLLVFIPEVSYVGVSRKIGDRSERARLRKLASEIKPKDGGLIVRTVGTEANKREFEREMKSLNSIWKKMKKYSDSLSAPVLVHREEDMMPALVRDIFSDRVDSLTVDSKVAYKSIRSYLNKVSPDLIDRVHHYRDAIPIFDAFGIESEIANAFERKVWLPKGGYIIIEQTEALVSIDVNTGKFTGEKDPERTILRTNLDASAEIARQLRLRDIGGIIVCDFIDMESEANRRKVFSDLKNRLRKDKARTKVYEVSELGLIEMSRQRIRPSLFQSQSEICSQCWGTGRVLTRETVARRIENALRRIGASGQEKGVQIRVHSSVALYLLEEEKGLIDKLQKEFRLNISIKDDPLMNYAEIKIYSLQHHKDITKQFTP